jgi:hypothetical protein
MQYSLMATERAGGGVAPGTTAGASWCGINDRIHFSASLFVGGGGGRGRGRGGRSVARPQTLAVPERRAQRMRAGTRVPACSQLRH